MAGLNDRRVKLKHLREVEARHIAADKENVLQPSPPASSATRSGCTKEQQRISALEAEVAELKERLRQSSLASVRDTTGTGPSSSEADLPQPSAPAHKCCVHVGEETFLRSIQMLNALAPTDSTLIAKANGASIQLTKPVSIALWSDAVEIHDPNGATSGLLRSVADAKALMNNKNNRSGARGRRLNDPIRDAEEETTPLTTPTAVECGQYVDSVADDICHGFLPEFLKAAYPHGVKLEGTWRRSEAYTPSARTAKPSERKATLPEGGRRLGGTASVSGGHLRRLQEMAKTGRPSLDVDATSSANSRGSATNTQDVSTAEVVVPLGRSFDDVSVKTDVQVMSSGGRTYAILPKHASVRDLKKMLLQSPHIQAPFVLRNADGATMKETDLCPRGVVLQSHSCLPGEEGKDDEEGIYD